MRVRRLIVLFLGVLCLLACKDEAGDARQKVSAQTLTDAADALKPTSGTAMVSGVAPKNSLVPVSRGGKTIDTIQPADAGDPLWEGVEYDMDGDGTDELVDVTLDDETGESYFAWTTSVDVDGDGKNENLDHLMSVSADGGYRIYGSVAELGTLECALDASVLGTCTICEIATPPVCEAAELDDLFGGIGRSQVVVTDDCIQRCEQQGGIEGYCGGDPQCLELFDSCDDVC